MEGTQDIKHSLKDLKRMAKEQKKAKKKDKKMAKAEKKINKQEAKMRKKGVFLEDVTTAEVVSEEDASEDFTATSWIRKSTEDIPYLEKKIDRMAERRESSNLHNMFEQKFGESLMIPDTYKEYELSEAEKRRLERLRAIPEESTPQEVVALGPEVPSETAVEAKAQEAAAGETPETEAISFWTIKQLWLYSKYGKDKGKVLKTLILIISVVLWLDRFILCLITFPFRFMAKKMKARKAKKVATEA